MPFGWTLVVTNIFFLSFHCSSIISYKPAIAMAISRREPKLAPENLFHWIAPTHYTRNSETTGLGNCYLHTHLHTSSPWALSADHAFQINSSIQHKQTNQRTAVTQTPVELPPPKTSRVPPKRHSTGKREKLYNHVKKRPLHRSLFDAMCLISRFVNFSILLTS